MLRNHHHHHKHNSTYTKGNIKVKTKWTNKVFLGSNESKGRIYLSAPSWDCGWYWGFGYLGNRNCHYHLDGIGKKENLNLFDILKKHFAAEDFIFKGNDNELWTFCELVKTTYTLRETAEVLGRGGSNYLKNPCKNLITNKDETKRINEIVLPAIFDELLDLLTSKELIK